MRKVSYVVILLVLVLSVSCSLLKTEPFQSLCPECGSVCSDRICKKCGFDLVWGTTLQESEVESLMKQKPEVIAQKIKTVGDARLYLEKTGLAIADKSYTPTYNDSWTFDRTGYEELVTNSVNSSGGFANYASYVLADNYEKAGQITFNGIGVHSLNYVYIGGKYYPFDIASDSYKWFEDGLEKLSEFGSKEVRKAYLNQYFLENEDKENNFNDVYLIYTQETSLKQPYGFPRKLDGMKVIVSDKNESAYSVLYWFYAGEALESETLSSVIPGYNSKLPEIIDEFPGKVIKGHPLYSKSKINLFSVNK